MENTDKIKGQIKIADDVIASIAGTAALEATGIVALAGGAIMNKINKKNNQRGVNLRMTDKEVVAEVNVVVAYGCKIQQAANEAQEKVKAAIENMTGLEVTTVNINVTGIDFEKPAEQKSAEQE